MRRWKLKACPRCKGDLFIEIVDKSWAEYCLQCGYQQTLKIVAEANGIEARPEQANRLTPIEN